MTQAQATTSVNDMIADLGGLLENLFTNTALITTVLAVMILFAAIGALKGLWHRRV